MRTRHLSDLCPVLGVDGVPVAIDLHSVSRVQTLELVYPSDMAGHLDLHICLELTGAPGGLRLRLLGVRDLVLGELLPGLYLTELEIEAISDRGLEGQNFELIAHYDRSFRCAFSSIEAEVVP